MNKVSLILPCYNEEIIIEKNLKRVIDFFEKSKREYEIIIGNDGSNDNTLHIVKDIAASSPDIKIFTNIHRGKGAILTESFKNASGDIIAFIDADLEIDISYIIPIIESIERGSDIAIGCKVMHHEWRDRPLVRRMATRCYNLLVRLLLGSDLFDHQAGIKGFRRDVILYILQYVKAVDWTWDTEVLIYAQKRGYIIKEIPVGTDFQRRSKVNIYTKPFEMAKEVVKLYLRGVKIR